MNWQTRSPKSEQHSLLPILPAHWLRPLQRSGTLASLCEDEVFLTTPSSVRFLRFPRRNWPFPVSSVANCLDFAGHSFSFPLTMQDKTEGEFFLQRLRNPLQDLAHHLLDCSASELLRRTIFGTTSSIFDPWSKSWGVARLLVVREIPPHSHPSEGVG